MTPTGVSDSPHLPLELSSFRRPSLMCCWCVAVQVFDLSVDNPRTVLAALLQRLEAQRAAGNAAAAAAREALRILVRPAAAGGGGRQDMKGHRVLGLPISLCLWPLPSARCCVARMGLGV